MSQQVAQAVALMQQAIALLQGAVAQPAAYAPAPSPAPVAGAGDVVMTIGKYKGLTLGQIAQQDFKYLNWVATKLGYDDNGQENPRFAAANQKIRSAAAQLLAVGNAVSAPALATPPVPAAPALDLSAQLQAATGGQVSTAPAPTFEDDIPF